MERNPRLELIFKELASDVGTYCASTIDADGNQIPRTEWQDGWNACQAEILDREIKIDEWWSELDPDWKRLAKPMLLEHVLQVGRDHEGQMFFTFNTSDLFAWGYSDWDKVEDFDMLKEIHRVWQAQGWEGIDAWWCRKVGEKPQWPVEKKLRQLGVWTAEMDDLKPNHYDASIGRWKEPGSYEQAISEIGATPS